jgi:hypothetical protein
MSIWSRIVWKYFIILKIFVKYIYTSKKALSKGCFLTLKMLLFLTVWLLLESPEQLAQARERL